MFGEDRDSGFEPELNAQLSSVPLSFSVDGLAASTPAAHGSSLLALLNDP